mgnify:CR=1 FL=1
MDVYDNRTTPSTPSWKTILVGGLNKGGKGFYALDITDPASVAAAAAAAGHQVAAVLRGRAVLCGIGVEVGADRTGDDALAFVIASHRAAEFFNDAHGFVSDRQPLGDRILAFEDMHVRAANGGGGHANQRIGGGLQRWQWLLLPLALLWAMVNQGIHGGGRRC